MELWIRSQDELKLVKVNYVYVIENKINSFSIYGETIDSSPIIGRYKTKERALEVLDEIEERISLLNTMCLVHDNNSLISFKKAIGVNKIKGLGYPYQMPKE